MPSIEDGSTEFQSAATGWCFASPLDELEDCDSNVRVSFWWLRSMADSVPPQLIYGSVVPTRMPATAGLRKGNVATKSFSDSERDRSRRRLIRLFVTCTGRQAWSLIQTLTTGATLNEASDTAGLHPAESLGDAAPIDENWHYLPPSYFPVRNVYLGMRMSLVGRSSPSNAAGCVCTRICPPDRLKFLDGSYTPDEILRWLAEVIEPETGLRLPEGDADALGSIEIFAFPSLDERERRLVDVTFTRNESGSVARAAISVNSPTDESDYLVQLRTQVVNDIATDQISQIDPLTRQVSFEVPEPIDGVFVRIWKRDSTGAWTLWHEQLDHFLRSIGVGMNLGGLRGTLDPQWLKKLDGTRAQPRADALRKVSQVSAQHPMDISTRAGWETSIRTVRDRIARACPVPSGGQFFPRGWEGDRRVDFAEWLRDRLSEHRGKVVLIDPYFDVEGLELIALASGAANEVVVLTCTQITSQDDVDGKPERRDRLVSKSQELRVVLRGVKLRLLDLQSRGGGKKQLFHDRYLLTLAEDDLPQSGFNLSTSLQSATRTSPLLVTPIPRDIIGEVAGYVATLLTPSAHNDVRTLYPPPAAPKQMGLTPSRAHAALAFADIMNGNEISAADDPRAELMARGMLESETDLIASISTTTQGLKRVAEFLNSAPLAEAALVWDGAVEAALSGQNGEIPRILAELCGHSTASVTEFLVTYLRGHGSGELVAEGHLDHLTTLAHVFAGDFKRIVKSAHDLLDEHPSRMLETSYGVRFAVLCVADRNTSSLDILIQNLAGQGEAADRVLSAIAGQLATSGQLATEDWISTMATSRIAFVRALSAMSSWRAFRGEKCTWNEFLSHLSVFPQFEQREVLARCIHEERIRQARATAGHGEAQRELPEDLAGAFLATFSAPTSLQTVLALIPELSGPLVGNHATSIQSEILQPLLDRGLLPPNAPFMVWDSIVRTKMKGGNFYRPVDIGLAETWGATFWSVDDVERARTLEAAEVELRSLSWVLDEPLIQSRGYKQWQCAVDNLAWWQLLIWGVMRSANFDHHDWPAARELARRLSQLVADKCVVDRAIGGLGEIATQVSDELRSILESKST